MQELKVVEASGYDLPTLTKWYIDLRNARKVLKQSIKPTDDYYVEQMAVIERELAERCVKAESGSLRSTSGTVVRAIKSSYKVVDPYAFRQWIKNNPEVGVDLISATITPGELSAFLENGGELPEGVTKEDGYTISVRAS